MIVNNRVSLATYSDCTLYNNVDVMLILTVSYHKEINPLLLLLLLLYIVIFKSQTPYPPKGVIIVIILVQTPHPHLT